MLIDGSCLAQPECSGVQRFARELLAAFEDLGLEHELAVPPGGGRLRRHLWMQRTLPRLARGREVLLCPGNLAPLRLPEGVRSVVVLHSVAFLEQPQAYSWSFRSYYGFLIARIVAAADRLITVSQAEKARILRWYPEVADKLFVVAPGVSAAFVPGERRREDPPRILFVGSLASSKGLEVLARAFERVHGDLPHRLTLVGARRRILRSPGAAVFDQLPQDRVEWVGEVSEAGELAAWYRKAELLVLPSLYESFGLPALEAMACGTPVIASGLDALREACGDAAIYVEPGSDEALAGAIVRSLADEAGRVRSCELGLERARGFRWDECARRVAGICEGILSSDRVSADASARPVLLGGLARP